ncbi:hypothetical protein [Paraclostridium sordellii]|uniref:hypothetical protein n=2 Tax=Paraclostridium sordellii TaxID=1505 RepID=UPI00138B1A40|nr:hypothetical protein [Paeniclostridium sordellii]MCH1966795.1 hypothetical protein [Paeniclostridium sordellii]
MKMIIISILSILGILIIGTYIVLGIGSIVLLILKIKERQKEKQDEDWDEYDDY